MVNSSHYPGVAMGRFGSELGLVWPKGAHLCPLDFLLEIMIFIKMAEVMHFYVLFKF